MKEKTALRVNFDTKLKLDFHGANVPSDTRLLVYRELDDTIGLIDNLRLKPGPAYAGKDAQGRRGGVLAFSHNLKGTSKNSFSTANW